MTNRIVFIDSKAAEYQSLLSQLPVDSDVYMINAEQDSVMQILAVLQTKSGIETIDIISHGKPGKLILGTGELSNNNLANYAEQLKEIGKYLNYSGDILLYGCEVAQGKIGQQFIEQMAELTGVNVAASVNLTGNAEMGGDWVLEAQIGNIQTSTLKLSYQGVLANFIGTPGNDILNGSVEDDSFTGGLGNDTLIGGVGSDVAIFSGNQVDYEFSLNSNGQIIVHDINPANGNEGTDTMRGIETFRFADGDIQNSPEGFQVNTTTFDGQYDSSIATLTNGSFIVSWTASGQDSSNTGIYVQLYDARGVAQGSEFRVNTNTADYQERPSITALTDGSFVVTWQSASQDSSGYGVYGQRYDASGNTQGSEFRVNTYIANAQWYSSITALTTGGFVVTWQSDGQDGSFDGIYAQRYDATGVAKGNEFQVNTYTTGGQYAPSIAPLINDGFVVTWTSTEQDGSSNGVYAQRYDTNGVPQGDEFRVNTYINSSQTEPSIASLINGGFVVSWMSDGQDGSDFGVYAKRYDLNGLAQGSEFRVNTHTASDQYGSFIMGLATGGFVVSWISFGLNGFVQGIYAQRYDANGVVQGSEFLVSASASSHSITALSDGGFIVSWTSNKQVTDIYAQRYDVYGEPVGGLTLTGSANDDHLNIATSVGTPTKILGMAGNDVLRGGVGNDILDGRAGNDILIGWSGADAMIGGLGNDTYFVENVGDIITENLNQGTDTVNSKLTYTLPINVENLTLTGTSLINGTGNAQVNLLIGNNADNQLNGGAGNDTLNSGSGNDTLIGWSGADAMIGGSGNDSYFVENVGDVITENLNQGNDTVSSRLAYTLPANVENLTLTGTSVINGTGNAQANIIVGNAAANQLSGNAGNDTLDGKTGNNVLTGGAGNDIFKFTTKAHIDTITDYNVANDTVQLENGVFTALNTSGILAASQFRIGTKALDANDFIIYNKTAGTLLYESDGTGAMAAIQIATVGSGLNLTNADIVVV